MPWRTTLFFCALLLAIVIFASMHESEAKGVRSRRAARSKGNRPTAKKSPPPKRKTFYSSVTYSQTQGKKLSFNDRFKSASSRAIVYLVATSPIYSRRYMPYHDSSNIVIPKHRALNIKREEYRVETNEGRVCSGNTTLKPYDPKKVSSVTTKVSYKAAEDVGKIKNNSSIEDTDPKQTYLTLSAEAIKNYVTEIEIRVSFNESILELVNATSMKNLTNCTVLIYKSEAYVVELSFASKSKAGFLLVLFAVLVNLILT